MATFLPRKKAPLAYASEGLRVARLNRDDPI